MLELATEPRGVILPVLAHPAARKNGVLGVREGMLRVAVTAAPEKGKANKAIVAVLGDSLGLPKSAIQLVAGETSSRKRFLVTGASEQVVRTALVAFVE